jgi:hypothetical protein
LTLLPEYGLLRVKEKTKMKQEKTKMKRVYGVCLNARNGQKISEGTFDVRELTERERKKLPECVSRLEGPTIIGTDLVVMSEETSITNGGFYVLMSK